MHFPNQYLLRIASMFCDDVCRRAHNDSRGDGRRQCPHHQRPEAAVTLWADRVEDSTRGGEGVQDDVISELFDLAGRRSEVSTLL